jgi:hypothetical protein
MKATFLVVGLGLALTFAPAVQAGKGHDAGYKWAEKHSIDDPDNCYDRYGNAINNSPSSRLTPLDDFRATGIVPLVARFLPSLSRLTRLAAVASHARTRSRSSSVA